MTERRRFNPSTTLVLVALEDEFPADMAAGWLVGYTGAGKINAAMTAERMIHRHKPEMIINYGTAGAVDAGHSGLLEVTRFHQRDMDVRPLGFALGQTPFEGGGTIDLGRPGLSCGTGDQFATAAPELKTDLVDMEVYAIARVALAHNVGMACFKYISDNADADASQSWRDNLHKGAALFAELLSNLEAP